MSQSNADGSKRKYIFSIHGRSNSSFAQQRIEQREEQRGKSGTGAPRPVTLAAVADSELLRASFQAIRNVGGRGAGPDGVTYEDLGRSDEGAVCRATAQLLRSGRYRPSEPHYVRIKKIDGGLRTLTLRSIIDRAVARAAKSTIEPVIDPHFLSTSYGFRPGRHVLQFLAALAVEIEGGRRVLAVDDVRKAFDNVRIDRVLPRIAQYVVDPDLLALIATILRGGDRPEDHPIGIDQGCGISPLVLNVQLHHALDVQLKALTELPIVHRYADNLATACAKEADAIRVTDRIREWLLPEGHSLKGEGGGIFHLEDGQEANLLGFHVQYADGRVRLRTPCHALDSLKERLEDVWALSNPVWAARIALLGWMNFFGPGIRRNEEDGVLNDIRDFTDRLALQEALDMDLLRKKRLSADQLWKRFLSSARTGRLGEGT